MTSELTPYEAESLRSGYLPPSAIPKAGAATLRYFGIGTEAENEPVPYSLTPEGEAALREIGPYPGSGDPERLAEWCGFPSAAAMEAAYREDAREMAAPSVIEARWEAEMIAEAEAAEDPEAEPWP